MSDCRIPMPSYKAPIHTREQDELRVTAHFKDGLHPQDFVANRDTPSGTRVLDYLESDGERYERVSECEMEPSFIEPSRLDFMQEYLCSECGEYSYMQIACDGDGVNYCSICGARVKEVDA